MNVPSFASQQHHIYISGSNRRILERVGVVPFSLAQEALRHALDMPLSGAATALTHWLHSPLSILRPMVPAAKLSKRPVALELNVQSPDLFDGSSCSTAGLLVGGERIYDCLLDGGERSDCTSWQNTPSASLRRLTWGCTWCYPSSIPRMRRSLCSYAPPVRDRGGRWYCCVGTRFELRLAGILLQTDASRGLAPNAISAGGLIGVVRSVRTHTTSSMPPD